MIPVVGTRTLSTSCCVGRQEGSATRSKSFRQLEEGRHENVSYHHSKHHGRERAKLQRLKKNISENDNLGNRQGQPSIALRKKALTYQVPISSSAGPGRAAKKFKLISYPLFVQQVWLTNQELNKVFKHLYKVNLHTIIIKMSVRSRFYHLCFQNISFFLGASFLIPLREDRQQHTISLIMSKAQVICYLCKAMNFKI